MTTLKVDLADDLAQRLREASRLAQTTPEALITQALVVYLSRQPGQREMNDPLAGMFDFGDEHFAENSEAILQSLTANKGTWTIKP